MYWRLTIEVDECMCVDVWACVCMLARYNENSWPEWLETCIAVVSTLDFWIQKVKGQGQGQGQG